MKFTRVVRVQVDVIEPRRNITLAITDQFQLPSVLEPVHQQHRVERLIAVGQVADPVYARVLREGPMQILNSAATPAVFEATFLDDGGVGGLFGRHRNAAERTELLVIITPRVLRSDEDARAVSRELRDRMQGLMSTPLTTLPALRP